MASEAASKQTERTRLLSDSKTSSMRVVGDVSRMAIGTTAVKEPSGLSWRCSVESRMARRSQAAAGYAPQIPKKAVTNTPEPPSVGSS